MADCYVWKTYNGMLLCAGETLSLRTLLNDSTVSERTVVGRRHSGKVSCGSLVHGRLLANVRSVSKDAIRAVHLGSGRGSASKAVKTPSVSGNGAARFHC